MRGIPASCGPLELPVPAWLCPGAAPEPLQWKEYPEEYPEEYPGGRDHRISASSLVSLNIPSPELIPRDTQTPPGCLQALLLLFALLSRENAPVGAAFPLQPPLGRTAPKSTAGQSQSPELGCHNPRRAPGEACLECSPFPEPGDTSWLPSGGTHTRGCPETTGTWGWVTAISREAAEEGTDPEQGEERWGKEDGKEKEFVPRLRPPRQAEMGQTESTVS